MTTEDMSKLMPLSIEQQILAELKQQTTVLTGMLHLMELNSFVESKPLHTIKGKKGR